MNPGFSFGSYVSGTSCVHRLDPRTKLIAGCAFIVVLLGAVVGAAYGNRGHRGGAEPVRHARRPGARRLGHPSHQRGGRANLLVHGSASNHHDVGDEPNHPDHHDHRPDRGVRMGAQALRPLRRARPRARHDHGHQVSRGARLSNSPARGVHMLTSLMVPLFTSVFRHAETLSAAMDARCYHGGEGRTHLHPLRFAPCDGTAAAFMAVLAGCVAAIGYLL